MLLPSPTTGQSPGQVLRRKPWRKNAAFTLIEVMIAFSIFVLAVFAILELVSDCLRNARRLQKEHIDTGPIMTIIYQTNQFKEGTESGDFPNSDLQYEVNYAPDVDQGSNGLWHVQATLFDKKGVSETNWALVWGNPPVKQ